jgi:hypothetical protein
MTTAVARLTLADLTKLDALTWLPREPRFAAEAVTPLSAKPFDPQDLPGRPRAGFMKMLAVESDLV